MTEQMRENFERWMGNDGEFPEAVERSADGYKLAVAQNAWMAWEAAWQAALSQQPALCERTLEAAAKVCEELRTIPDDRWNAEQAAASEALTQAANEIRALATPEQPEAGADGEDDLLILLGIEADDTKQEDHVRRLCRRAKAEIEKLRRQAEGLCDGCGQELGDAFCATCAHPHNAGERGESAPTVPDGWRLVPDIGTEVSADHPITSLNPAKTFIVTQIKVENGRIYARGEETMWFHVSMLRPAAPKEES